MHLQVNTSSPLPVNMSTWAVFTKGLKWVWGSSDSEEWPRGLTGCWGGCVIFSPTPLVMREHIKKSFYTQTRIHMLSLSCYTPIEMVVWQSSEYMSSEEVCLFSPVLDLSCSMLMQTTSNAYWNPASRHLTRHQEQNKNLSVTALIHCLPKGKMSADRHKWEKWML